MKPIYIMKVIGGVKTMNEKGRLNTLEAALNDEMRERTFYLKKGQRTKNLFGKAMFQQIGDKELEHYERLKDCKKYVWLYLSM